MKAFVIAACTALVAGAGIGGALTLPEMTSAPSPDLQIPSGEDPNMAMHRIVMGSDPWTAPPPYIRVAAVSTPDVTDTADADLAAWERQSHAQNEAARLDYVRDAQAYAYSAVASPVVSKVEQPSLTQAAAPAPTSSASLPVDLVSLDSEGPRG